MPPHMLILNDDVLRQVADYLLGSDALSLSLTSKHVYDLAIHRVSAIIECKDSDKLWSLHRTLYYDHPERAKRIQTFIVRGSVFPREELYGSDDEIWDDDEVMQAPVAPLIVELLRIASNIRTLTIECFEILRASDPGIVAAVTALRRLSRLELFRAVTESWDFFYEEDTEHGLSFLQDGGWDLTILSLDFPPQHGRHLYPALLRTIAAFPRLVTLRLIRFLPQQSFLQPEDTSLSPSFPSIQKLFLNDTTPHGLNLVRLCPNASLVSILVCDPRDSYANFLTSSPRWNTLRSLILSSTASMYIPQSLLDTAFHVHLDCPINAVVLPDGSDAPDMNPGLAILKRVSPVWAQLWIEIGEDPVYNSLHLTEATAPRLRFLELKITVDILYALHRRRDTEDSCWLDEIPSALRSLPLVCLRLHFSKIPRHIYSGNDENGPIFGLISREDIQRIYNAGAKASDKLPLRCAGAIRTLKYIAVADEDPSWDDENDNEAGSDGVRRGGWESADELYGGGTDEYEYDSEWYAEKIKTLQWWRVERRIVRKGRTKTKLRTLTAARGKEVQRYLEEAADPESMERIDGELGLYAAASAFGRELMDILEFLQ